MNDLIEFIVGDATTFEPSVMVGLIVFVLILESLCTMVGSFGSLSKGGRYR